MSEDILWVPVVLMAFREDLSAEPLTMRWVDPREETHRQIADLLSRDPQPLIDALLALGEQAARPLRTWENEGGALAPEC